MNSAQVSHITRGESLDSVPVCQSAADSEGSNQIQSKIPFLIILSGILITNCALSTDAQAAATHHYRIGFAADSTEIRVEGRLARDRMTLSASKADPATFTKFETCTGRTLATARRLTLAATEDCFRYSVAPPVETGSRWRQSDTATRFIKFSSWLLLPTLESGDEILVVIEKPDDLQVSVPWQQIGSSYRISPSPRSSEGFAVIGRFSELDLQAGGLAKPAAYIGPAEYGKKMRNWLSAQATGVTRVYGRFPNPQVQIVVVAVASSNSKSPVPFGHVIRDQGETIQFFVDPARSAADLAHDWTAAHELAHVALPYISEKWVAEGFASYYQNVLQARNGRYSEREAWGRLANSFAQAAAGSKNISPNATRQHDFWRARMMIYWSGAALALHADVALREAAANKESLDSVLARFAACCLPSERTWRARDFFLALDRLSVEPVFVRLYDEFADTKGMPPTAALFTAMGISGIGESVRLSDDAPQVNLRRAIMLTPPD
jgi:hypothetical protein